MLPNELLTRRVEWEKDLLTMSTLADSLPAAEAKERQWRSTYVQGATAMSLARHRAAVDLIAKVNGILPELEMKDKRASLLFTCPVDVEGNLGHFSVEHSLDPRSISPRGWDTVTLRVTQVQEGGQRDSMLPSISAASDIICLIRLVRSDDDDDGHVDSDGLQEEGERDILTSNGKGNAMMSVLGTLSSGEGARLALALESVCCYEGDDDSGTAVGAAGNPYDEEGLLVFDEIDAHVGGDAAVAVAR